MSESQDNAYEKLDKFLTEVCMDYSKKKQEVYAEHDIQNTTSFSIFTEFFGNFYMENPNSDILKTILDPNTKEIGRKFYLEEFVKFLGLTDEQFDCNTDYEVSREENRIDLLIKNENQAIIIENKIYNAIDQVNQLARYMQYVEKELGIKNYTVVYMPLMNDGKLPPLDQYDNKFQQYVEKLKKELKIIYFVDEEKSIAENFLPACIERINEEERQNPNMKETCESARTFIKHYKIMLKHLGGEAYMISTNNELIEKILSNKENYEAAWNFITFWNGKNGEWSGLRDVVNKKFVERFGEALPQPKRLHDSYYSIWESANGRYYIYCFIADYVRIGFMSVENETFSEAQQDYFLKIVEKVKNSGDYEKTNTYVGCTVTLLDDILDGIKLLREN